MDPDAIFIILLYFTFLILTIGSIIGLSKKIWNSTISKPVKLLFVGLSVFFLVIALLNFSGPADSALWIIAIVIFPSFLIALNLSINIIRKHPFDKFKFPVNFKIIVLTILFSVLIPTVFYLIGNFFDWLNLMGSGG